MPEPLVLSANDQTWKRPGFTLDSSAPASHYPYVGVTPNDASLTESGFANGVAAIQSFEADTGGLTLYRVFTGGGIGTWGGTYWLSAVTANSDAAVYWSFKTWNETDITAWMNGKPDDGNTAFLSFYHEPEDQGWNQTQIATWRDRCSRLIELRDATGRTDIKCGPTYMDWTLDYRSGRDFWGDWYVGPPVPGHTPTGYPTDLLEQDFHGWDPYNDVNPPPGPYRDPQTEILDDTARHPTTIFDVARITGVPFTIGEYGTPVYNNDYAGRAQWIDQYLDACVDIYNTEGIKCLAVSYWSNVGLVNPSMNYQIHDDPLALAALSAYAAQSRNHYGIGV